MAELTCVIAFINEGAELHATLSSIRQTAGDRVDIVLVDDGSDDGIDYRAMAALFGARYTRHSVRQGSAPSKHEGVGLVQTPYFLLLDGHMRFYSEDWPQRIVSHIEDDADAIYCCRCRGLEPTDTAHTFGAYVEFSKKEIFAAKWLTAMPDAEGLDVVPTPCIIGASYAGSVETFSRLRGFEGLKGYGAEEEYLSIKAWMSGGGVRQIRDVVVGHRFNVSRIVGGRPKFITSGYEVLHNRMVIASTLLPAPVASMCMDFWKAREKNYTSAFRQLEEEAAHIEELRDYYSRTFEYDFDNFEKINNKARRHESIV